MRRNGDGRAWYTAVFGLVALLLCASLGAAAASPLSRATSVATVALKDEAQVEAAVIRLTDVAAITGEASIVARLAEVVVGASPRPGQTREIYLPQVAAHARQAGVNPESIAWVTNSRSMVRVRAAGRTVTAAEAREMLRGVLADRLGTGLERVEVEVLTWPETVVAEGASVELRLQPEATGLLQGLANGYFTGPVDLIVAGRVVSTVRPRARVKVLVKALVARKAVARGAEIRPDDFVVEERALSELSAGAVTDVVELGGKQAARPIRAGSLITSTDLAPRLLVKRGEMVTVTLNQGDLQLTLTTKSLGDGAEGDEIKVQNPFSSRALDVVVTGPGTAEIGDREGE